VVIVAIAVAGYMLMERFNIVDALYMTVITLSTVGLMEVAELSPGGRIFTIVVILTGVSTLGYAAASFVEYLVGGHLVARGSAVAPSPTPPTSPRRPADVAFPG